MSYKYCIVLLVEDKEDDVNIFTAGYLQRVRLLKSDKIVIYIKGN